MPKWVTIAKVGYNIAEIVVQKCLKSVAKLLIFDGVYVKIQLF